MKMVGHNFLRRHWYSLCSFRAEQTTDQNLISCFSNWCPHSSSWFSLSTPLATNTTAANPDVYNPRSPPFNILWALGKCSLALVPMSSLILPSSDVRYYLHIALYGAAIVVYIQFVLPSTIHFLWTDQMTCTLPTGIFTTWPYSVSTSPISLSSPTARRCRQRGLLLLPLLRLSLQRGVLCFGGNSTPLPRLLWVTEWRSEVLDASG